MSTPPSDPRATSWPLASEIAAVFEEAVQQQRRVTKMLLKSAELRIVVVGMPKGSTWPEHAATGRVVVRVEQGCVDLRTTSGDVLRAQPGVLVALDPREPHDVVAGEDTVFLLMVAG